MDLRFYLKINQLVHIEVLDRHGEVQRFSSRVENISDDRIALASPLKDRIPLFVPRGNYVTVFFSDKLSIYNFRSRVVTNIPEKVALLVVDAPENVERIQKREYVRVAISLNVRLDYQDEEGNPQNTWCRTRDISGGGLMLISNKALALTNGTKVSLSFQLEGETVNLSSEIMRIYEELDASGISRHIIGIKFTNLMEKDRQYIIKFVYQRQIELKRKGLL